MGTQVDRKLTLVYIWEKQIMFHIEDEPTEFGIIPGS